MKPLKCFLDYKPLSYLFHQHEGEMIMTAFLLLNISFKFPYHCKTLQAFKCICKKQCKEETMAVKTWWGMFSQSHARFKHTWRSTQRYAWTPNMFRRVPLILKNISLTGNSKQIIISVVVTLMGNRTVNKHPAHEKPLWHTYTSRYFAPADVHKTFTDQLYMSIFLWVLVSHLHADTQTKIRQTEM